MLTQSVHKIRRFNFKHKEKKSRRKMQSMESAETELSDARIDFLCFDSNETEDDLIELKHYKSDMTEEELENSV